MGRILRRFLDEDRGQVGIGTLIIFIAMILVAAVAAGVLLRTSGTLQTKATATGEQATTEVSTTLRVVSVIGHSSDDTDIDNITVTVQLAAGSGDVDITDVLMSYQEGNEYVNGIDSTATDYGFNYTFIKNETGNSVIESGETVEIRFDLASNGVALANTGDQFTITISPKAGQTTTVRKTVPAVIGQKYIVEWG